MSAVNSETRTILDYLDDDCWRIVLDHVPTKDVIRSERVCKRWQTVVLVYLRGARIGIDYPHPNLGTSELQHSVCWILVRNLLPTKSFESWTNKLGASLVSTYCVSEECLKIIGENCPNLEAIKLIQLPDELLLSNRNEHFRWLRRICFVECRFVSDHCISQFVNSPALQELEIHQNQCAHGNFLKTITPDLKSLVLNGCRTIDFQNVNYISRFTELTKLVLDIDGIFPFYMTGCLRDVHYVLRNLRKLEHLDIYFNDEVRVDNNWTSAVCKLANLKHLGGQVAGCDDELLAVTKSCTELRSLNLENCSGLTSLGVSAACRVAPHLTTLGFHKCGFTDDDVAVCVRECPELTTLDVRRSCLTRAVMARAAAARQLQRAPRPLHLYLDGMIMDLRVDGDMNKYKELILHF